MFGSYAGTISEGSYALQSKNILLINRWIQVFQVNYVPIIQVFKLGACLSSG